MGTAEYGDTEFSDLTEEEFKERRTGLKPLMRHGASNLRQAEIPDVELPEEYDWRNYNAVTPVKDQGSCGSCWAFSVTGNIEGMYGVQHGELVSLSEQELVDCDVLDSGCNGGLPENAYKAIQDLGGLELETDYPYNAHENKCHFDKNITRVQVIRCRSIQVTLLVPIQFPFPIPCSSVSISIKNRCSTLDNKSRVEFMGYLFHALIV